MDTVDPTVRLIFDLGSPAAVWCLGWWLSGKFRAVEKAAQATAETVAAKAQAAIDSHELVDRTRHDENLRNFQRIFMTLARAKLINGTSPNESHDTG